MSISTIKRVAVLGAGVVGLSTAFQVIRKFPKVAVTVIADKFTTETTSHGAAGIFNPSSLTAHPELKSFCRDSFAWYNHLVRLPDAYTAGVHIIDGYQIAEKISTVEPLENLTFKDFVYSFDEVDPNRLKFLPADQSYGKAYHYTTLMVECRRYLPWLQRQLESLGVTFQRQTVKSLGELADGSDLIFNCAGLRNFQLVDDKALFPVRGHIIRVKAPWIKQFYLVGTATYIVPGADLVVLGGTRQANDWDENVRKEDADAIRKRCFAICPSLAQAEIDHHWVGLRPSRNVISVESGGVVSGPKSGRMVNVINNYGHGKNGVGLSMGTAVYAVQNVLRQVMRS